MTKKVTKQQIWVVIPAYNEQHYLGKVLQRVNKYSSHVAVVDDGSTDKTQQIARRYTPHVLKHKVNLGKGAALKTGCEYAFQQGAQAVVLMDADDQHDARELPVFFAALGQGHQMVLGIRDINQQMPFLRSLWNRSVSYLVWLFFQVYIADIPCGYKAFHKRIYPVLKWQSNDYAVEMEIAARIGKNKIKYLVVPIKTIYIDTVRGMTMLNAVSMMSQVINWKFSL